MDKDCEDKLRSFLSWAEAARNADQEQAETREILKELHRGRAEAFDEVVRHIKMLLP